MKVCVCFNSNKVRLLENQIKGIFIEDSKEAILHKYLTDEIEDLIYKYQNKNLKEWSSKHLRIGHESLSLNSIISDFLTKTFCKYIEEVSKCEICGLIRNVPKDDSDF